MHAIKIAFLSSLILILLGMTTGAASMAEHSNYAEKVSYQKGKELVFPDFVLEYLGTSPGALYPGSETRRIGEFHEFKVSTPIGSQVVRWSSGTGEIGPAVFEVNGKCFWLELIASMRYGPLEVMEAVVSLDPRIPSTCARRK